MLSLAPRARRSALYLPASNLRAIAKARELDCDVVILDLEDAVAPQAKQAARAQAVAACREGGFAGRELVIRVNALDTEWGADDVAALAGAAPDAVLLPKVCAPADISAYRALAGSAAPPLWAMIETTRSLVRLYEIAAAPGLAGLVLGTNDLASEMGARPGVMRAPFAGIMGLAVAAARAHGLIILDGVFNDLQDPAGLATQCRQAAEFGFDGKTLIHPSQIEPCNAAFMPGEAEIAWANRILAAFDAPENAAKGAIRVDGKMVERLHLLQARRTLCMARSLPRSMARSTAGFTA